MSNYKNTKVNGNTAITENANYYKNAKGEWTKLTEDEMKKNKALSTSVYVDYKQKIYSETDKKRKNGELSDSQSLKKRDKIQILLDSEYSNKEKVTIYENYIKSDSDLEYKAISKTNINFDEYLKYKQQEFISDKQDDGSLNGKTVNKSKQKKVEQYLNSIDITDNQRLLLYAMNGYSMTSSQKKQLAEYTNNLNLSKEDKLRVFDKFSGFKVYKDGRVTW